MRWIHRTVDVNDVILNSLGASLGLIVLFLLRSLRKLQPGALRGGIRRLLDQADLAAQFGSRAREHAQRAYSIAVIGDVVEREYRAVLQEAR